MILIRNIYAFIYIYKFIYINILNIWEGWSGKNWDSSEFRESSKIFSRATFDTRALCSLVLAYLYTQISSQCLALANTDGSVLWDDCSVHVVIWRRNLEFRSYNSVELRCTDGSRMHSWLVNRAHHYFLPPGRT
jgi:hypothetical protein